MMLYDIFYRGNVMDKNVAGLPPKAEAGAYAVNTNWDKHMYRAHRGRWVPMTPEERDQLIVTLG